MINVNYRYVEGELNYLFDNADMVALVHERRYADRGRQRAARARRSCKTFVAADVDRPGSDDDISALRRRRVLRRRAGRPERRARLRRAQRRRHPHLYTGGTTGFPKGVMWRHEDFWRVLCGGIDFVTGEFVADEYDLSKAAAANAPMIRYPIPPMIHGATQSATWMSIFSGQTTVLAPEFDADDVWRTILDDKVGLYCRNRIEIVIAMLGIVKAGAILVNVNFRYVEGELNYLFDNSDMVALVHERRYADRVANVLPETPNVKTVLVGRGRQPTTTTSATAASSSSPRWRRARPSATSAPRSADDIYLLYTGGTTGFPKGVMWRHEDIYRVLFGGTDFATGEPIADEYDLSKQAAANAPMIRLPDPADDPRRHPVGHAGWRCSPGRPWCWHRNSTPTRCGG